MQWLGTYCPETSRSIRVHNQTGSEARASIWSEAHENLFVNHNQTGSEARMSIWSEAHENLIVWGHFEYEVKPSSSY